MRIIIARTELEHRSKWDLDALLALVLQQIAHAPHGSPEWQNAVWTLNNIRQELASRNVAPRPRGPGF